LLHFDRQIRKNFAFLDSVAYFLSSCSMGGAWALNDCLFFKQLFNRRSLALNYCLKFKQISDSRTGFKRSFEYLIRSGFGFGLEFGFGFGFGVCKAKAAPSGVYKARLKPWRQGPGLPILGFEPSGIGHAQPADFDRVEEGFRLISRNGSALSARYFPRW
jgi:hypothetical protein